MLSGVLLMAHTLGQSSEVLPAAMPWAEVGVPAGSTQPSREAGCAVPPILPSVSSGCLELTPGKPKSQQGPIFCISFAYGFVMEEVVCYVKTQLSCCCCLEEREKCLYQHPLLSCWPCASHHHSGRGVHPALGC